MSDNIIEKTIEQIKSKHIEPISRWKFLLKNYTLWIVFYLTTVIGALAFSLILFVSRFEIGPHFGRALPFNAWFCVLPYSWLLILAVFVGLAYLNVRYTEKGYRYNPYLIVVISVLVSIVLGTLMFISQVSRSFEGMI